MSKDARTVWLDEGRIETIEDSERTIDPEDVRSSMSGGMMTPDCYPYNPGFVNAVI